MSRLSNSASALVHGALVLTVATAALLAVPRSAQADTLVFVPPASANHVGDLQDLDHFYVYTWLFTNIKQALPGQDSDSITGAKLKFSNIANWNTAPNKLFMHLLDSALTSGYGLEAVGSNTAYGINTAVARAQDETSDNGVMRDDLGRATTGVYYNPSGSSGLAAGTYNYGENGLKLVANNTANTPIGNMTTTNTVVDATPASSSTYHSLNIATNWAVDTTAPGVGDSTHSFSTTPSYYELDLTPYLANLRAYIDNGDNFALGFDPDCHFFNEGVTLEIYTQGGVVNPNQFGAPEPASMVLLGTGLAALFYRRRRASKFEKA